MSKYVKDLITDHVRSRLEGVQDAVLVNVVGLDANANNRLRTDLRGKGIHLLVVKNSLAARATAGTPLGPMFEGTGGTSAICWGGEDIVALAKEVMRLAEDAKYQAFETRGGTVDGEKLTAAEVVEVSKWPSREEQLSLLLGQILAPGANLAAALLGPGSTLAGQINQRAEAEESEGEPEATAT